MARKPCIGIIGYGFVGQAVSYGFEPCNQIIVDPKYSTNSIRDLIFSDVIFICVPTPMGEDGSCDTTILKKVLDEVRGLPPTIGRLIVLKSTVPPQVLKKFSFGIGYEHDYEIYNPEFLTERGAKEDFVNPQLQIFGGHETHRLEEFYRDYSMCNPAPTVFHGTVVEAAIIKYMVNTFLATKVEFFNAWKDVADKYDANFAKIAYTVGRDPRIGLSHTKIPGPDGKRGFGGACFPKDLSAILADETIPLLAFTQYSNNTRRREYQLDDREREQKVKFE